MNTVLLAAPLIVFALVLLLGFTGCRLDSEGARPGPPTDGTDGNGNGNGNGNGDGNGGPTPVPYVDEVMSSSPIAYWRLSDPPGSVTAKDEIGAPPSGDHPGEYQGTVTLGLAPSLNASDPNATPARFDGESFVEVVHDPVFEMAQFTVEALVYPDSVVAPEVIVRSLTPPPTGTPHSGGWALSIEPRSPEDHPDIDGFFVTAISDGLDPAVGPEPVAFDLTKLVGDAWHLAVTYDGAVLTLYWDGVKRVWGTFPYVPNTQEALQIGVAFKGAIQEVAVYATALTAEQITTHYLANTSP